MQRPAERNRGRGLSWGLEENKFGSVPEIITATSTPFGQMFVGDNATADLASFATFDDTTNYASTAGTISTVDYQVNGASVVGSTVLADHDSPSFVVTDSAANVRTYYISDIRKPFIVTGADLDLSYVEDSAITTQNLLANWTLNGNSVNGAFVVPALPDGLSVTVAGTALNLTGTPTTPTADGTYTVVMQDEYGVTYSDTFTLEITSAAPPPAGGIGSMAIGSTFEVA